MDAQHAKGIKELFLDKGNYKLETFMLGLN
jgi:hypothetical protein